jgi:hypothetical protein
LEDVVLQTEEDISGIIDGKHGKRGIPTDASKLILSSNTFDEQSHAVLVDIRDIVGRILAAISGNIPPSGGHPMSPTSNIPPTPPTPPTPPSGGGGTPPVSQQKPIKTVTINKPNVVM